MTDKTPKPVVWTLIPPEDSDKPSQVYYFPDYFKCFIRMRPRVVFAVANGWTTVCEPFDPEVSSHIAAKESYGHNGVGDDVEDEHEDRIINKIDRATSKGRYTT